jgi:hypothetical protein
MFADRVYDQDFLAAMADRGFYVFTSPPCHAAAPATPPEPVAPGHLPSPCGQDVAQSAPAVPALAEAA